MSDTAPTKTCTGCGRTLPRDAEHFHRRAVASDGFQSRCKDCLTTAADASDLADIKPDESPEHLRMNEQLHRLHRMGLELAAQAGESRYFAHVSYD